MFQLREKLIIEIGEQQLGFLLSVQTPLASCPDSNEFKSTIPVDGQTDTIPVNVPAFGA